MRACINSPKALKATRWLLNTRFGSWTKHNEAKKWKQRPKFCGTTDFELFAVHIVLNKQRCQVNEERGKERERGIEIEERECVFVKESALKWKKQHQHKNSVNMLRAVEIWMNISMLKTFHWYGEINEHCPTEWGHLQLETKMSFWYNTIDRQTHSNANICTTFHFSMTDKAVPQLCMVSYRFIPWLLAITFFVIFWEATKTALPWQMHHSMFGACLFLQFPFCPIFF